MDLIASEEKIRKARVDRVAKQARDDRATRERLQNGIGPMEVRPKQANAVDMLKGVAVAQGSGIDAIQNLRKMQIPNRAEGIFNRLHPSSLARSSNFEIGAGDPGNQPSRFSWNDKFTPPRRVPKVRDAAGSMTGESPGGEITEAQAEYLLATARALIEAVRARAAPFASGRGTADSSP